METHNKHIYTIGSRLSKSDSELPNVKRNIVLQKATKHTKSLSVDHLENMIKAGNLYNNNGKRCIPTNKIGEGASSNIYEINIDSESEDDEKKVVKILSKLDNNTNRKILVEEIKFFEKSNSPQIVKFFGTIRDHPSIDAKNSEVGVILEHCEHGDLLNYLKKMEKSSENLNKKLCELWCIQILLAIKYLHADEIIHRDIKSLNYLVNGVLNIKLTDFGQARINTPYNRATTLRRLRSSPCWTAPELCDWDTDDENIATYASDIFALTIVMWEVINFYYHLKYVRPYKGTIYNIYHKISHGIRPKVDELFSDDIRKYLDKGWAMNPKDRPDIDKMITNFRDVYI